MSGKTLPGSVGIVQVSLETAALLDRLAPDVFDETIDSKRLAAYLEAPLNALFVAVQDNTVVGQTRGTILLQPDTPSELFIDNLGVTPACRRRGIARMLVTALMDWGRAQGCEECWVGTEPDNREARSLYDSLGHDPAETFVLYFYDL